MQVQLPNSVYHSFDTEGPGNTEVEYVLASGLDSTREHDVVVYKSTEAQWNSRDPRPNFITFGGFALSGPSPVTVPGMEQPKSRKIEFLGDSITAGFCNLCRIAPSLSDGASESNYDSWPNQICQVCVKERQARTQAHTHTQTKRARGRTHTQACT